MIYKVIYNKIKVLLEEAYQFYCSDTIEKTCSVEETWSKNIVKAQLFFKIGQEVVYTGLPMTSHSEKEKIFDNNKIILQKKFDEIISTNKDSNNKIAAYFVSKYDYNGFLLGTAAMMNHFYEIKNLQEHGYVVYPYLVTNLFEISIKLLHLPIELPPVDVLFLNAHGTPSSLEFDYFDISTDLRFSNLKMDANIILNSCSTAKGSEASIAAKIAKDNPGTKVFGAKESVFVSNINFSDDNLSIKNVEYQGVMLELPSPFSDDMNKFCFSGETNELLSNC